MDCPTLRQLKFLGSIPKEDLEQVVQMDRLPRPICLVMDITAIKDSMKDIMQLLYAHPEIKLCSHQQLTYEYLRERHSSQEVDAFFHIFVFNIYGRYLIDRQGVLLSLWPQVLENANDKPSIIYEFLKGPAFAGRKG